MKNTDKRLDEIFDKLDDLGLEGKFEEVDKELAKVDVDNEDEYVILLGYLTITFYMAPFLKNRTALYDKIRNKFINDGTPMERVNRLLGNLRDGAKR